MATLFKQILTTSGNSYSGNLIVCDLLINCTQVLDRALYFLIDLLAILNWFSWQPCTGSLNQEHLKLLPQLNQGTLRFNLREANLPGYAGLEASVATILTVPACLSFGNTTHKDLTLLIIKSWYCTIIWTTHYLWQQGDQQVFSTWWTVLDSSGPDQDCMKKNTGQLPFIKIKLSPPPRQ